MYTVVAILYMHMHLLFTLLVESFALFVQGPVVTVDCAYLNFGLIPFNGSSCITLCVSNHSHSSAEYSCRQLLQERDNGFMVGVCKCRIV